MIGPDFAEVTPIPIPADLAELLPAQGSIELQNDGPGKTFTWHTHSVDEELYVLDGSATLFWVDADGEYHDRLCAPGARITLSYEYGRAGLREREQWAIANAALCPGASHLADHATRIIAGTARSLGITVEG